MISLADVRDWLKGLGAIEATWTIGRIEAGKERRCCVFQRQTGAAASVVAIGGRDATGTLLKEVQVLVHWNANHRETEEAAQALYDTLAFNPPAKIGEDTASYIELALPEPVDLGSDENGIFERAIWLQIHYYEKGRDDG